MYSVRRRLINFRVTDEEFERLKNAASLQGSRCLSEFARFVMLGPAGERVSQISEIVDSKLSLFDRRLNILESNVARLVDALENSNDPNSNIQCDQQNGV